MEEYYILENNKKEGPFSIGELEKKQLLPDTQIWSGEDENWHDAEEFPVLSRIISIPKEDIDYSKIMYCVSQNDKTYGPYCIDELFEFGISTGTSVWSDENESWKLAEEYPELKLVIKYDDNYNEILDFEDEENDDEEEVVGYF